MKLGSVIYTPPQLGGEQSKSVSLSAPLVCSRFRSNHNLFSTTKNTLALCLSFFREITQQDNSPINIRFWNFYDLVIYYPLLMSGFVYAKTCSLMTYCGCVGGTVLAQNQNASLHCLWPFSLSAFVVPWKAQWCHASIVTCSFTFVAEGIGVLIRVCNCVSSSAGV